MLYTLLVIIMLPIAITILFRSPLVQTLSARIATKWISDKFNRNISIESLSISFFDGLYISGIKSYDHNNKPLLMLNSLKAIPEFPWIGQLNFSNIEIDGASITYGRYEEDDRFAFNMFLDFGNVTNNGGGIDFKLYSENIRLTNSSFQYFDETHTYSNDKGMDYADIGIIKINGYLKDFYVINDSLNFNVMMLKVTEKSGIEIENLSADISISSTGIHAYNSKLSTEKSQLDFDLEFNYSNYNSMSYFIDSVDMIGEIRTSVLDLSELGFFDDLMFEMPDVVRFYGSVNGKVNELNGDNIVIEYAENTSFTGDIYIKGLPDFFNSYIRLGIHEFKTSKCDIQSFILPIKEKTIDIPIHVNCVDDISITGNFEGYYGNFKSNLDIRLHKSKLIAKIEFNENRNDSIYLKSNLLGENLNIGNLLGVPEISGPISFNADIEIKGTTLDNLNYSFKTLISSVGLLGYDFKRIKLNGNYVNNSLSSTFRVGDKNLMAFGSLDLSTNTISSLVVNANIAKANIDRLGFWDYGQLSLSSNVHLSLLDFDLDFMNAELLMQSTNLIFEKDVYYIDTLHLIKEYNKHSENKVLLKSDIVDAMLTGNFLFSRLASNTIGLMNYYYPFSSITLSDTISKNADLSFKIKDSKLIHDQLIKGLEIEIGTSVDLALDFEKKQVDLNLYSESIKYYGIDFIGNILTANTKTGILKLEYDVNTVMLKDSTSIDKTVLGLDNFGLRGVIGNDSLGFDIFWQNSDTILLNKGVLAIGIKYDSLVETLSITNTDLFINGVNWKINDANHIYFDTLGVTFSNLDIYANESRLKINGRIPKKESDTLEIVFDKWDISYFDILTNPYNIDLQGIINGNLNLGMIGENPTFISNIKIGDLQLNNQYLGQAHILNTWDNINRSIYFKAQVIADRNEKINKMFLVDGYYYPFRDKDMLDIVLKFNDFVLPSIEPFLKSYVSEIKGKASGEVLLKGTIDEPVLTGYAKIDETSLIIKYLNTRYSFSNIIEFDEDMLSFDKLVLFDTLGNNAKIVGYLKHKNFKDPWLDVNISSEKFLFFNTTRKMNELYYGTGILSGNIKIEGKPNDIKLDIITSTKQGTRVFIPLDYSTGISDKDYIIFIKTEIDSIAEVEDLAIKKENAEKSELKYEINLEMGITPTARINIALPSNLGDIVTQGSGDLNMEVKSNGEFSLFGEYIVDRGVFNFSIENIVNKRFELVEGGRISWTGDPYTANINLKGMYRVRTSLSSLGVVIDTSASYKNKVNVECYIILGNQLLNPSLKFEIKIPELDPDLQRAVYAVLDTTNVAMMNQQMISLLVLGTFSYSNASNINLTSSYYTILTNQLSSVLSRMSDDFDIGVNYKPGDDITNEEFEVALSTQLFDDRLTIDGNFGVTYDRSQQNASNIVGDVDISYKLTEDGRWRLKVFNHSNVNSWYNTYDKVSPYTQGVGVAYRKGFNNFKELFERKYPRSEKEKNELKDEE